MTQQGQPITREDCQRGAAKSVEVRRAKRDAKIAGLDALAAYKRGWHDGYQAAYRAPKKARA